MAEYVWCHGPKCHTYQTQDRIRGVKGNKVLRTRKIRQQSWNAGNYFSHFCSQGCYSDFLHEHWEQFIGLHPRTECLETPILDPTKQVHGTSGYVWSTTKIEVDESRNTG